jgi:hypothetical protein
MSRLMIGGMYQLIVHFGRIPASLQMGLEMVSKAVGFDRFKPTAL